MNINNVTLGGFLATGIELKHTEAGMAIGKGAISVTKKVKGKEPETSFIDFVCFGKWAEISADASKKGDKVILTGELKQERWESKDGQKRSRVLVVANQIYTHKWEKHDASKPPSAPPVNPINPQQPISVDIVDEEVTF